MNLDNPVPSKYDKLMVKIYKYDSNDDQHTRVCASHWSVVHTFVTPVPASTCSSSCCRFVSNSAHRIGWSLP